jgi:iron(III) transport system substrate-binding protein
MSIGMKIRITRSSLLRTGAMLAVALTVLALWTSGAHAGTRAPVKVLDFQTSADVAKAEQEGELVYYGHDSESAIATLLDAFKKDFPKIKTGYVRLQTGALYAKLSSERSANRFLVDVVQFSEVAPAIDLQKKGGYELYVSPEAAAYKPEYQSNPGGSFTWAGVTFAGIAYNKDRVKGDQIPKVWKDILNPAFKDNISAKLSSSGSQHANWYMLRKLYGNDFWKDFAAQKPRGFDSRAQLFDRLSKGDDAVCAMAEYAGYILVKEKGANIEMVEPPDGLSVTPIVLGIPTKAPHPEAAKLFIDWALSPRGQSVYQNAKILLYGSVRKDAPPMATGKRLSDFKLMFPTDWDDFVASHGTFVKEWNAIMGL